VKVLPYYLEDEGIKCSYSIGLKENTATMSEIDAKAVSEYMESCVVIDEWLSNIKDPISGQLSIPSKTWSDGDYVWDSSHIHYLKNYRVRLPEEFVRHVKSKLQNGFDFNIPTKEVLHAEFELILGRLAEGDESFYAKFS
jgi:hypothetical protein